MHAARLLAAIAAAAAWVGAAACASSEPPGASSCTGCHPANPRVDTAVPRLAGRAASDIVAQMQAFKSGQRPATVMDRIAKGLADAEIEAIATWYAQQEE
jgi:cytochrome c553